MARQAFYPHLLFTEPMKLRKIKLKNVRSFLEEQTFELAEEISIIIGPNGGGKTNLLDTAVLALRIHLLKSWIPRHSPVEGQLERFEWAHNDGFSANLLEKHSAAAAVEQRIELTIEVTPTDVESMALAKNDAEALQERARYKYVNIALAGAAHWQIDEVVAGKTYTYSIVNGQLKQGDLGLVCITPAASWGDPMDVVVESGWLSMVDGGLLRSLLPVLHERSCPTRPLKGSRR